MPTFLKKALLILQAYIRLDELGGFFLRALENGMLFQTQLPLGWVGGSPW